MRTGEEKRGEVLAEDDRNILLDSKTDGLVIEVPRSDVSIWEREDPEKSVPGGYLSFYSTSPNNRRKPRPVTKVRAETAPVSKKTSSESATDDAAGGQPSLEAAKKMIEDLVAKHPEIGLGLKEIADKAEKKSSELDKLAAAAKQS